MVAKISIGNSLYGALTYNGEKINKEKGRLLDTNKIYNDGSGTIDIHRAYEDFLRWIPTSSRTERPMMHISLNPHPDDVLSDTDFTRLAHDYMQMMGFADMPYMIYKHADIDRHHVHIVALRVGTDGRCISDRNNFYKNRKVCRELEQRYGLKVAEREKITPDMPIKKVDPSGDIKRQVANTVKMVGMRYKFQTLGEYNAVLSLYNIRCEQTDGRVNGREYHGLVYFATDDEGKTIANPFKASRYTDEGRIYGVTFIDHNTMTVLNGSRLGKQFSANALNERFNNPQAQQTNDVPVPDVPVIVPEQNANTHSDTQSQTADTQTPSDGQQHSTGSQHQSATSHSATDYGDSDFTLPSLDLFQPGQSFNPDEEEFRRRMQRKKKKGHRPKF